MGAGSWNRVARETALQAVTNDHALHETNDPEVGVEIESNDAKVRVGDDGDRAIAVKSRG